MKLSQKIKKGIYYVFVTGSGVKVENWNNDLLNTLHFSSYCSFLNFLKLHNIKYKTLQNSWDVEVF